MKMIIAYFFSKQALLQNLLSMLSPDFFGGFLHTHSVNTDFLSKKGNPFLLTLKPNHHEKALLISAAFR